MEGESEEMKITCSKKNYGGAFDVDPEMFFTRDDLDELNQAVLDHISETFSGNYQIADSYIGGDDNQQVHIEVDDVDEGITYQATAHIDMRKIRNGSDLRDKYALRLAANIIESIKQYSATYNETASDVTTGTTIKGYEMLPGPGDYDPPQYDEPKEADEVIEYINVQLDADIIIDEKGNWEYEDERCPWASPDRGSDWYSEEYSDVYLDDVTGVVEKVDELMIDMLPSAPGRYHVSGNVNLYYSIIGVDIYEEHEGMFEENSPSINNTFDTDQADVYYSEEESSIEDFICTPVDVNASTQVCAGVTFSTPKASSSPRYGMYTTAKYDRVTFSIYYNEIDTSPEADPVEMLSQFRAQISEIHPYDEGRYLSAILQDGVIYYRENGKQPIKKSYYLDADSMGVENTDWCDEIVEQAIIELRELNSSVESRMSHN